LFAELEAQWQPHDKQLSALAALLFDGNKRLAIEWGRRTGKGDLFVAAAGLWGKIYPNSHSYYFVGERTQGKEILWDSNKITDICPGSWILDMTVSDLRVYWTGSTINKKTGRGEGWFKIDGCDQFDKRRGIEPKRGLVFVDEAREVKEEFISQVIKPTLARWASPFLISSTPPDDILDEQDPTKSHWMLRLFDEIKQDKRGYYSHATSLQNPHLSAEWLAEEEQTLANRGESDIWQREYLAQRVPKTTGRKFPMLSRPAHVMLYDDMLADIDDNPRFWDYYALTDPAGSSVWAWNIIALNKFDRRIYVVDEIDETNQHRMTTTQIWPVALNKMMPLESDIEDWHLHYDEAETWFANEMIDKYDISFLSSDKARQSKTEGFTIIKDTLLAGQLMFSDRCKHTLWELENYEHNKSRDHHVDLLRYFVHVSGYGQHTARAPQDIARLSRAERRIMQQVRDIDISRHDDTADLDGWADDVCGGID
jgi:hypothetical protein